MQMGMNVVYSYKNSACHLTNSASFPVLLESFHFLDDTVRHHILWLNLSIYFWKLYSFKSCFWLCWGLHLCSLAYFRSFLTGVSDLKICSTWLPGLSIWNTENKKVSFKTSLNDRTNHTMTVLRLTIKGQKEGSGPIPGNPHPFPKIVGIILPFISLWNYPVHKN